jgi:hypothetical protein
VVALGKGTGVEDFVIVPGTPPVVLLGRRAVPSRNMASKSALAISSRYGASCRDRNVIGVPVIIRMWWTVL